MAKNDDIRDEIEQLRNQLDAIKQTQKESGAYIQQQDTNTNIGDITKPEVSASGNDTDSTDESDLASQLQELMDVLNKEIKDSNPTTMLVVFSLGVLVGRLLPR